MGNIDFRNTVLNYLLLEGWNTAWNYLNTNNEACL